MSETIKIYNSMAEFYASIGGALNQEVDFTIHPLEQIHSQAPFKSPLFRANYYSIVMINTGQGQFIVDNKHYDIKPCTIYFSNPGHVKGFEIYEKATGYVITFAESFLKRYVHEEIFNEFPFLIAEIAPPQYPELSVFQNFRDLATQLLQEYQGASTYKFKIIGSLMVVLLLKIKERFWNEDNNNSTIVMTFKRNLEAHFRDLAVGRINTLYQVQDYANAQHLHPSYLTTVIKTKTGKSVNNWISEKIVSEAQAILSRSGASVQEVAYQLGFKEPGHFSRFFKKHTGMTPSDFRQNHSP